MGWLKTLAGFARRRPLRRGRVRRRTPELLERRDVFYDSSPPALLQWFESSQNTMEQRMPDLFMAGYGAVWVPPPGRADTSDFSVGYDVYDRFDLGQPGKPTLYGTETGLKTLASELHEAGLQLHTDFVINHNGYSNLGTPGFQDAGGYPGFFLTFFGDPDGDFNSAYSYGDLQERLAGLIDIAQNKNYTAVRNPVPGFANNIQAGSTPAYGRLANVADENNRRFYPDVGHNTIYVFDPKTGEQNIPVYQFNLEDPLAGDPSQENALGYLMRNAQWLVQVIGVDGLRLDAAKHVPGFTLDFIDRAIYRQNPRLNLDGSQPNVFTYSEVYDGNPGTLLSYVRKDINPFDPGRIGGNRDVLDFSLYFAMKENLEHAGQSNAWQNVRSAGLDFYDDGLHNGSSGIKFVMNADVFKPYELNLVAQAYTLMTPGNTMVYFNGKEFGDNRAFPKDGESDALSVGGGGSPLTRLLDIRNTHSGGNYIERWIDDQGLFAFEREASSLVLLSNRGDGGFDSRTLQVNLAPGTHLIELTGNASDPSVDPYNNIPEVVDVFSDNGVNKVNVRFPRNRNANGDWTGKGYLVYGLAGPQSGAGLELSNVAFTLAGDSTPTNNYENGTQRQTDVQVIQANSFNARLLTREVRLLGSDSLRDIYADGDSALLKLDGGIDVNHNGHVDFVNPGSTSYGYEYFGNKSSPLIGSQGIGGPRGDGEFIQTIDATQLSEGYHYLTARAYRSRTDNGPPVFSDFKRAIYIDRLPPDSTIQSFAPINAGVNENRNVVVRSVDKTATDVHVFLDLPAGLTRNQILAMVNDGNRAGKTDRDLFQYGYFGLQNGNHALTVVTYETTGNVNVQRFAGQNVTSIIGAGLGDLNADGQYNTDDVSLFRTVLLSNNSQFHSAADLNADGQITYADLLLLRPRMQTVGASAATLTAVDNLKLEVFSPVLDTFSITEDQQLGVLPSGVLGNDHHALAEIQLGVVNAGSFNSSLGVPVTLYADGGFTYDPRSVAAIQALPGGQMTTDSFNYTVTDGFGNNLVGSVQVNLTGVNDSPTITSIGDQTILQDSATGQLSFTIGDAETAPGGLQVSAGSSSALLVAPGGLALSGTTASRSLVVTPVAGATGMATITVSVSDGTTTSSTSFTLTVNSLGPTSWRNADLPEDVNKSGSVNNLDFFLLSTDIHVHGPRVLPALPLVVGGPPPYFDVDGNGTFNNLDVYLVRNYIRSHPAGEGEGPFFELPLPPERSLLASGQRLAGMAPPWPGRQAGWLELPLSQVGVVETAPSTFAEIELASPIASPLSTVADNLFSQAASPASSAETNLDLLAADLALAWSDDPLARRASAR